LDDFGEGLFQRGMELPGCVVGQDGFDEKTGRILGIAIQRRELVEVEAQFSVWLLVPAVDSNAEVLSVEHDGENSDLVEECFYLAGTHHPGVHVVESLARAVQIGHLGVLEVGGCLLDFHKEEREASITAVRGNAPLEVRGDRGRVVFVSCERLQCEADCQVWLRQGYIVVHARWETVIFGQGPLSLRVPVKNWVQPVLIDDVNHDGPLKDHFVAGEASLEIGLKVPAVYDRITKGGLATVDIEGEVVYIGIATMVRVSSCFFKEFTSSCLQGKCVSQSPFGEFSFKN